MDGFVSEYGDLAIKLGVFVLVQALVYLILTKSSNLFSSDNNIMRSLSFRPARSVSVRRMLALLSDLPPDGELSPSAPTNSSRGKASASD